MKLWRRLCDRFAAMRLAYQALTCDYDPPTRPHTFRTSGKAKALLADARGMWHHES